MSIKDVSLDLWKSLNKDDINDFIDAKDVKNPLKLSYPSMAGDNPLKSSDYFYTMVPFLANPGTKDSENFFRNKINRKSVWKENSNYYECVLQKKELKKELKLLQNRNKIYFLTNKANRLLKNIINFKQFSSNSFYEIIEDVEFSNIFEVLLKKSDLFKKYCASLNDKQLSNLFTKLINLENEKIRKLKNIENISRSILFHICNNRQKFINILKNFLQIHPTELEQCGLDIEQRVNQQNLQIKNKIEQEKEDFINLFLHISDKESNQFGCEKLNALKEAIKLDEDRSCQVDFLMSLDGKELVKQLNHAECIRLNAIVEEKKGDKIDDECVEFLNFDLESAVIPTLKVEDLMNEQQLLKDLEQCSKEIADQWNKTPFSTILSIPSSKDTPQEFYKIFDSINTPKNPLKTLILDSTWRILCAKSLSFAPAVNQFIRENTQLIIEKVRPSRLANLNKDEFSLTNKILKEQKRHSFERFLKLGRHYEKFVNCVQKIINIAETMHSGSGKQILEVIQYILAFSYKENSETVFDNHHDPAIMGYEDGKVDEEELKFASNHVNWLLMRDDQFQQFERAHTFPFPAMMNWKMTAVIEHLNQQGGMNIKPQKSRSLAEIQTSFSKSGFTKFKKESDEEAETLFQNDLIVLQNEAAGDLGVFIRDALGLLCRVHLYLLSETEYVPGFINQMIDSLSEWKISEEENYKKNLADTLIKVLNSLELGQKPEPVNLQSYFAETYKKIDIKMNDWSLKPGVKDSDKDILYLVCSICALQVKQAVIAAELQFATQSKKKSNSILEIINEEEEIKSIEEPKQQEIINSNPQQTDSIVLKLDIEGSHTNFIEFSQIEQKIEQIQQEVGQKIEQIQQEVGQKIEQIEQKIERIKNFANSLFDGLKNEFVDLKLQLETRFT